MSSRVAKWFFRKARNMFDKMYRSIFGVPPGELAASSGGASLPEYIRESDLHHVIHAAASSGEEYVEWRVDDENEQWFRRVPIHAAAVDEDDDENDFSGDDDDDFSGDDGYNGTGDDDDSDDEADYSA